jgi:hypothetical protein
MNNIHGFRDLQQKDQLNNDNFIENYIEKVTKLVGQSLAMGVSFGTGALLSFYLLKHLLMNKTA